MRVVTRHSPRDPEGFLADAAQALQVLARQPGFVGGEVGRSPDAPQVMLVTTRWADVGSMRRGMGSFDAKVALAPVMASAADEPSAFEVLVEAAGGELRYRDSARAAGEASAGTDPPSPGRQPLTSWGRWPSASRSGAP